MFHQRQVSAQSIAEYVLVVLIVIIFAVGAILVLGLFNQNRPNNSLVTVREVAGVLSFEPDSRPICKYLPKQGTIVYAEIYSTIPRDQLSVTSEKGTDFVLAGSSKIYAITSRLSPDNDLSLCPQSVVVQAKPQAGGALAVYPVEVKPS